MSPTLFFLLPQRSPFNHILRLTSAFDDLVQQGLLQAALVDFRAHPTMATLILSTHPQAVDTVCTTLTELGLTCAASRRKLLALQQNAAFQALQDFAAAVLTAQIIADLARVDVASLAHILNTTSYTGVLDQLATSGSHLALLVQSTAPGMIRASLCQALLAASQAQSDMLAAPLAVEARNSFPIDALRAAVRHWFKLVTDAFAMLPESDAPDWREKLDQLERLQLGHRPIAAGVSTGGDHGPS